MSDIRKYKVTPTSRLHLRGADEELLYAEGPNGEPDKERPMIAVVFGPGSKQYEKASAARNNKMVDRLKKKGKTDLSAEEQREEQVNFLSACTQSFENVEYEALEGEALHRAVYSDREIGFIPEQVGKHLGEWGNFTSPSTKS